MRAISGEAALSCGDVAALLNPYLDDEFDAAEGAAIDAHLAGCASCSRRAGLHTSFRHLLRRSARPLAAPAGLRAAVLYRLDRAGDEVEFEEDFSPSEAESRKLEAGESRNSPVGEAARPKAVSRFLRNLTPRAVAFAAAAAGIAAWIIGGGLQHPLLQADADRRAFAEQSVLDDGIAIHARTLPLDFAASDAGSVQRWLQGRLDFGVRLPHFAQQHAPELQGVRLSTLHAHQAAVVSYTVPEEHGHRVSLVIVDDPQPQMPGVSRQLQGREVWMAQSRGYNVASWRSNEIVYSLISDLDERDVLELVKTAELR